VGGGIGGREAWRWGDGCGGGGVQEKAVRPRSISLRGGEFGQNLALGFIPFESLFKGAFDSDSYLLKTEMFQREMIFDRIRMTL
jgi:hypothetical protein